MLSRPGYATAINEADLSAAYTAFTLQVLRLCTGNETGGMYAFLVLNHTRIELHFQRKMRGETNGKDLINEYLDKASDFLQCSIEGLKTDLPAHTWPPVTPKRLDLRWTGDIVELTELVISIQESKCINHGKLSTIELFNFLSDGLGLERAACFSHYTNMKNRRNPTKFLDKLKNALLRKIARDDEKPPLRPQGLLS
jgi:hypothetical protein